MNIRLIQILLYRNEYNSNLGRIKIPILKEEDCYIKISLEKLVRKI